MNDKKRNKPSILVVDDDPALLRAESRLLQRADFMVIEAATAAKALRLAKKHRPDVILLDVVLPDTDGLTLCQQIKNDPVLSEAHIILLSGLRISPAEQSEGLEAGADDYIARPVSNQELLARIRASLRLKQTEDTIRESEARYRHLFENMTSGVAVYQAVDDGQDFIFKDFNATGEKIEGIKRDEVVSRRVTEIFPGIKDFGLFDVLQKVWQTGEAEYFPSKQYQDERISGWRENHIYKLPSGEIVAVYNDVTEQKQAEQSLRQSEEKLRTLFALLPVGISIVNQKGDIVETNPALGRILQLSKKDLFDKKYTHRKYIKPDGTPMRFEEFPSAQAIKKQKMVENVEIGVVKENGEIIWTNVSAVPVAFSDWAVVITTADITERKEMQEAFRHEHDLLEKVMETSPIAITVINRQGEITFANSRAEQILGLSRSDITHLTYNAPDWQITDFEGQPLPDEHLPFSQVMTTGQPLYDIQHAIEWPNGRRVLLSINAAPLFDEVQQIEAVVCAIEDITEWVLEEKHQKEQLVQELIALDLLSASPKTTISAQLFGVNRLYEDFLDIFDELSQEYSHLLDLSLEQRAYKVEHNISERLRAIARRLGLLRAGPRDVIELHSSTLKTKMSEANPTKTKAYTKEGHMIVLELMGYLMSYYRNHALGVQTEPAERGAPSEHGTFSERTPSSHDEQRSKE